MSEPRGTPETSMEEILASIRRIISEDGSPPAPQSVTPPPAVPTTPTPPPTAPQAPAVAASSTPPAPLPVPSGMPSEPTSVWGVFGDRPPVDGEALVLTQMLAEDGSVVALDRPAADAAPVTVASVAPSDFQPLLLTDVLPPSLSEVRLAPPGIPISPRSPVALSPAPSPPIAPAPRAGEPVPTELSRNQARDGGPTLEELVRQSLEPKVQEWLNANLKDIVERLVQREIERIRQRTE